MAKVGGKNKLPISSSDLKKAIVDRNNFLKSQNDSLSSRIKEAEKLVKSKEKELKEADKIIKSKLNEIDASEKYITQIKADIYSNEKESSKLKKVITELKGEETSRNTNIKKIEYIKGDLEDAVAGLEIRKQKAEKLMDDLKGLSVRKSVAESDLKKVLKEQEEAEGKIDTLLDSYNNLDIEYKEKKSALQEQNDAMLEQIDSLEKDFKKSEGEKDRLIKGLDEDIDLKDSELKAVNSLIDKAETEYIAWENKIKKAENEVAKAKGKIDIIKKNYENWKIGTLEQVAKMKLKNKIDNIDKAGLSDILNNG